MFWHPVLLAGALIVFKLSRAAPVASTPLVPPASAHHSRPGRVNVDSGKLLDVAIIALYIVAMLGVGIWGFFRSKSQSDYLVAGRNLGTFMYSSTMSAIVLGGASTVGGVGLGYKFGISGMWLVVAIAVGLLVLSLFFAKRLTKLKIFTVSQMLDLRYGGRSASFSGTVMLLYTFMLSVTSTLSCATIFHVLLGWDHWLGVLVGGGIVILYSTMGGMLSITLTDLAQFIIKTVGVFFLLLPIAIANAGGWDGMMQRLQHGTEQRLIEDFSSPFTIGGATIITYFVVYALGMLIGQDIWQRVFTARTPNVARNGGVISGVYCLLYGVAGALIGMAVKAMELGGTNVGDITKRDDVYASVVEHVLPMGIRGIVLAAALAAMMSTASGALIAASTVLTTDILPIFFKGMRDKGAASAATSEDGPVDEHNVRGARVAMLVLGIGVIALASVLTSVVDALTVAYDILVGGLLVPILGGLIWRRGTRVGAYAGVAAGVVGVLIGFVTSFLAVQNDPKLAEFSDKMSAALGANEPIYIALAMSAVAYVVASLASKPTPAPVMDAWTARINRSDSEDLSTSAIELREQRAAEAREGAHAATPATPSA